ncbi:Tap42 interacting protein [Elasticomyces elasticus]|uniref:Tap42 interacting protein n=1 Tax=Exophiala sideris TaxID=1016849 RepID=A0ABR0JBT1_9EURO|nr:Tap42 interacting protein [Elasticomyces elasticus]KAK5031138.1 Tap42 interacting protein [Exophiala sideris]KAK5038859.1 Tap42 interacting protein [Exophiala sideris]KAK5060743.1 Tap42 interacting protein [Exophiala sideris]KAK5183655.1 Tap42 interacting protein [Eurotiomycetes sp. CCFEE 6388]
MTATNGINGINGVNGYRAGDGVNTNFPSPTSAPPRSFSIEGFRITTQKLPILKAGPIEEMTAKLGIAPPEMIFGDNFVAIEHPQSHWDIKFDAFGALDRVDKTGEKRLKVAYSKEWQQSREDTHDIKEVVKPFDWSYTTDYKGELATGSPAFQEGSDPIPLELLRRPDPILFFDDVILYEDELADNGITMVSCKVRVMPARLLLLCRFFMRLDNVMLRLRDTRVYVDFGKREVIREYIAREEAYDKVRDELATRRDDVAAVLRDANQMSELLPVVEKNLERIQLGG